MVNSRKVVIHMKDRKYDSRTHLNRISRNGGSVLKNGKVWLLVSSDQAGAV